MPTDLLWEGQSYVIGEERGLEQGQRSIVSIILDRKLGKLFIRMEESIAALDLAKLASFAIAPISSVDFLN
ncbi:MAG: hypothetical protein NT070_15870 [Cyanobacteria bacterium]|nr:hypothetical protein [Cyanobacteriota bacterium]